MAAEVKQWITTQDGLENLQMAAGTVPPPGDNEVLVAIHTVSLNYRDTEVAMGLYTHHKSMHGEQAALVPCSDMCGVVTAVGKNVTSWTPGDRVLSIFNQTHLTGQITPKEMPSGLGLPLPGVLTTHRVFPEYGLVPAPTYLSDEEACTLAIAGVTAWMSLNWMRPIGQSGVAGEYVLLQGTGGVSIAGLQIAKASGAKVIITSSSEEKLAQARSLGADFTINYKTQPRWDDDVIEMTQEHGADVIFETGGAKTLQKSFNCVAWGGLIDCIGYLSGKVDDPDTRTNVNVLALRRNVTLKGILNGPKDRFEEMITFYEKHQIKPVVHKVFKFEEAKDAFTYLFNGSHFGKVVIRVK